MKKYSILALTLVLTAALLVGCGCTKRDMGTTSSPTVLPTNEEVYTTEPTTRATTEPTMATTEPAMTQETIDRGNGPLDDTTMSTTASTTGAR